MIHLAYHMLTGIVKMAIVKKFTFGHFGSYITGLRDSLVILFQLVRDIVLAGGSRHHHPHPI